MVRSTLTCSMSLYLHVMRDGTWLCVLFSLKLIHTHTHDRPNVFIQFEDFSTDKASFILDRYKNDRLCFNDDIQGTGAVCVAGT